MPLFVFFASHLHSGLGVYIYIYIYHITDINNLQRIIDSGGLLSKSEIDKAGATYQNIAYDGVQDRRATTVVPCGPGGVLHDYVPFYFAPRSPMLRAIHGGYVKGYNGGQDSIIYLVSTAQIVENEIEFVFSDGHGIMMITEFFQDLGDLDKVDWEIMNENFWANTQEDGDRKRRRQAEFLVHQFCPWSLIKEIGVKDAATQKQVQELIVGAEHKPNVIVRGNWYY